MVEKESRRIKTLSGFMKWASQFNDGEYLFRGVSNHSYRIEASACRRLPKAERDNPARLLRINKRLIEEAKGQGHDQKNGQRLSDLELLAELQHFGAATCLIDFSRNALVALWFACQQSSNGKANGKVVAVRSDDPARFKTVTTDLIEKDIDHFFKLNELGNYPLYQWEPKLQNNRIIAQHSVFVFGGTQVNTEAECAIIQSSKQEILKSLNQLSDITEASMYPDFDGFARLHGHDKPYIEPDAGGYLQLAIEAHLRGELDDAIVYNAEVIRIDPTDTSVVAQAHYNRGVAYAQGDDYDRAIEDYTKAMELNPNLAEAHHNRGVTYGKKEEYDLAIGDFNRAIELNPNLAEAYYNRGGAYVRIGNYEYAITDCTKAIELNPNDAEAYNNRGVAHSKKEEYDRAIEDFDEAIEMNPNLAGAYNNRGFAHSKTDKCDLAMEGFNKAIELNPNLAQTYCNRSTIWLRLKEWEKAKSDLTIAEEKGANVANEFLEDYKSVADFQKEI